MKRLCIERQLDMGMVLYRNHLEVVMSRATFLDDLMNKIAICMRDGGTRNRATHVSHKYTLRINSAAAGTFVERQHVACTKRKTPCSRKAD